MHRNIVMASALLLILAVLIVRERWLGRNLTLSTRPDTPMSGTLPEYSGSSKAVAPPVKKMDNSARGQMYDEHVTVTPFDPAGGIHLKYGRIYTSRDQQLAAFERLTGFTLPPDFLEMIGEYCEGGFDGHYRVYFKDGVEVQWHHLLLMKEADESDTHGHDTVALLRTTPKLFNDAAGLALFPFVEGYVARGSTMDKGYLAFDIRRQCAIAFVSQSGSAPIYIAESFREMMLASCFVFYG
jgi:hypothetical protein